MAIRRAALLSLEPWDDLWRRNQHLASRLVAAGTVESLTFVAPPAGGLAPRARRVRPMPGIEVVTPPLLVPRRHGGYRLLARWLRRLVAGHDAVWVNDPVAGAAVVASGIPLLYDVTDDWRAMPQPATDRARIVAGEDALARRARTVVCSAVLAGRWRERYGIDPTVVPNGVDLAAIGSAVPATLPGGAPHAVYVGTLHANRIDADLVADFAQAWPGTVHLAGPNGLPEPVRARLAAFGVRMPGALQAPEVPSWLVAADVLICPHRVDEFTLSLDAIKSHEYLATSRPVVATRSSGFQSLAADGLAVTDRGGFVAAALAAVGTGPFARTVATDWDERAAAFGTQLALASVRG